MKYLKKVHPNERVGIHVLNEGRPHVVEYNELSKENSELRDKNGDLVYNLASVNNVLFNTGFIQDLVKNNIEEYFK